MSRSYNDFCFNTELLEDLDRWPVDWPVRIASHKNRNFHS